MRTVFINIGLSLDGFMAPEGMTIENWDRPEYKDTYRLAYIRGPEGIIVALAEQRG